MIRCEEGCGRRFGGFFTLQRHRPLTWDRCRTPAEMRAIGLRRNRRHIWVRARPTFQSQIDFRAGSRVRLWFGKPWRRLTAQERAEYRARLGWQKDPTDASSANARRDRNAQAASNAGRGAA